MFDSFYNIWEQQQKIANIYNQIYSPELLKMQQAYSNIIAQMQPTMAAFQNISGVSTFAEQTMRISSFSTDKFLSAWDNIMGIDNQLMQNLNNVMTGINVDHITSMAQQITLSTEAIESFSRALSLTQSESIISNLCDALQTIPDSLFDILSDEEGYSKEEIQEELEVMQAEGIHVSDIEGLTQDQVEERRWIELWKKCPRVITMIWRVLIILICTTVDVCDSALAGIIKNNCIPGIQRLMVTLQGKDDVFFVKVNSAKLYTDSNSHSTVITKILYAEKVTRIESKKIWDKVIYVNPDGEEIAGWIAKRNLMTYKDYEFNADKLYEINR